MPWIDNWAGGRVWEDASGRRTYHIKRMVGGRLYERSTRATTERGALKQLEAFEADPEGYDPSGGAAERLVLDAALARAFLRWSRDDKGNSTGWVAKQKLYLEWWLDQLRGRDLRRLTVRDHLAPALEKAPARTHRIEVIKAFFAWLRQVRHVITAAEDPTFGTLPVPQARPEQWKTPKVIPREDHEKVLHSMVGRDRDRLIVLAGTGWHVTEVVRFAQAGIVAPLPSSASRTNDAAAVLVCPRRKSGEMQRTPVSAEVADAARRVLKSGGFSPMRFYAAVNKGCLAAKVTPFSPGRYRHSVATWAVEAGADPAAVAAFLGHKSPATTKRFYATLAVVPKVPTLA